MLGTSFEHWELPWVLQPVSYSDTHDLLAQRDTVIAATERHRRGEDEMTRLRRENELLRRRPSRQPVRRGRRTYAGAPTKIARRRSRRAVAADHL
jgi:hypothetical protein